MRSKYCNNLLVAMCQVRSRWLLCQIAMLTAFLVFVTPQSVRANDITHVDSVPLQLTSWNEMMSVPKFDPKLGTLTQVSIHYSSQVSGTTRYESLDSSAALIELTLAAKTELTSTLLNQSVTIVPSVFITDNAAAHDGLIDFDGPSGGTFPGALSGVTAPTIIITESSQLSNFIEDLTMPAPAEFFVDATGSSLGTGAGNLVLSFTTRASSAISVTYTFTPGMPGIVIEKLTNGQDADDPNGMDVPQIIPGDMVTWTYIITNTGDVPFLQSDVIVTDDQGIMLTFDPGSDDGSDSILSPNESWTYAGAGVAPNLISNPPPNVVPGCDPNGTGNSQNAYANLAIVTAGTVFDSDPSHFCTANIPAIEIEKHTNGQDADDPNGTDVPQIAAGDPITWTFIVTNTGTIPFSQAEVSVTDDQGVVPVLDLASDNGDGILSPGESWIYIANSVAPNLVINPGSNVVQGCDPNASGDSRNTYKNLATVTAGAASDTDPSHFCNNLFPAITIEKSTNGRDADDPNGVDVPLVAPGDPITWTYMVTNTGTIPFAMADVTVADDQSVMPIFDPASDDGDGILSPGESWTYSANGLAPDLALAPPPSVEPGCDPDGIGETRNAYVNVGSVTAGMATDFDPSHFCNPSRPGIDIEKSTNGFDADLPTGPQIDVGSTITWSYVVSNTGNVAVAIVEVMDDNGTPLDTTDDFMPAFIDGDSNADGLLNLNEVWHYLAFGIASAGQYGNMSNASGTDPAGMNRRQDMDPSHYLGCPLDINFDVDASGMPLAKGTLIAEQWAGFGIHFSTQDPLNHPLMVFDSSAPSGDDTDLGTPNLDFAGPGMGSGGGDNGGGPNATALGNVLIISEDADPADPDDHHLGGMITVTFDQPVPLHELLIIDVDEDETTGSVQAFDSADVLLKDVPLLPLGDNSVQTVSVQSDGISRIEIFLQSSGALGLIDFCP